MQKKMEEEEDEEEGKEEEKKDRLLANICRRNDRIWKTNI